jgi:hypothetical protein
MESMLALAGQGPGANAIMGPLAIMAVLVAVGFFLVLYRGSKIGWLFVVAALVYGWTVAKPIIVQSGGNPAAVRSGPAR